MEYMNHSSLSPALKLFGKGGLVLLTFLLFVLFLNSLPSCVKYLDVHDFKNDNRLPLGNPIRLAATSAAAASSVHFDKKDNHSFIYPLVVPVSRVYKALFAPISDVSEVINNQTCTPIPLLLEPSSLQCDRQPAFTGKALEKQRKVAHFFLFAFEVDTLLIMLHEEWDVVNVFFLVEGIFSHKKGAGKPLVWEKLKRDPRFEWAVSKVVHIILDHPRLMGALRSENNWVREHEGTRMAMKAVYEWNENAYPEDKLGPDDVFISGDVDEILSRENIYHLGWCEWRVPIIYGAIWMPMGALDRAFLTDWPSSPDVPYSFNMPTIYQFNATDEGKGRLFSPITGDHYVLGGMHLTNYAQPAVTILKQLTSTGYGGPTLTSSVTLDSSLNEMQKASYTMSNAVWRERVVPLESLTVDNKSMVYIPWYLRCHPELFPAWYGKLDPRNRIIYPKVKQGKQ